MDTFKHRGRGPWHGLALVSILVSTAVLAQAQPEPPPDPPGVAHKKRQPEQKPPEPSQPLEPTTSSPAGPPLAPTTSAPPSAPPGSPPSSRPDDTLARRSFSKMYWGNFKTDKCTGVGLVQKSAILYGIQGSWENACSTMGATIDGYKFEHPSRCVNARTSMWGEFDVPDDGCMPRWEGFKAEGCRGVGLRQFSSNLVNIRDIDWNDACMRTHAVINGIAFDQPARCRLTRDSDHDRVQRGEFDVPDPSCGPVP